MRKRKGILFGIIIVIVSITLLYLNESKYINIYKSTQVERDNLSNIENDMVNDLYEDSLVCVSGKVSVNETLSDSKFGVSVKAPKLVRVVEMYQYKPVGDKYTEVWSDELFDTSYNEEYKNPVSIPYSSTSYYASEVMIGAFRLSFEQLSNLDTDKYFNEFNQSIISSLGYVIHDNYITNSSDINNPKIGDIRISFKYNDYKEMSVLALQKSDTFETYNSSNGENINVVVNGIKTGNEVLDEISNNNQLLLWISRVVLTVISMFGILLILNNLKKLNKKVILLGHVKNIFITSILLSICLSLLVISIPYLFYNIIVSVILIFISIIFLWMSSLIARKKS